MILSIAQNTCVYLVFKIWEKNKSDFSPSEVSHFVQQGAETPNYLQTTKKSVFSQL